MEIRSLMERSSRFLSLSGLSGVFAGIFALAGATAAYVYFHWNIFSPTAYNEYFQGRVVNISSDFHTFFFVDAFAVLGLSLIVGYVLTSRKAKKQNLKVWDGAAKRMAVNLAIPLITGGVFCFVLLNNQIIFLIAPCTLIFYGLALLNASKYTFNDIRYLGVSEIILGLIGCVYWGYGLLLWAVGFGILHIVYGIVMWNKYERRQ